MGIVSVSSWEEKLIVVGMRESQPTSWASTEQSETWAGELAAVFVLWRRTKSIYEQRSLIFLHVILLLFSIGYFPFLLLLVDLCVCSFVVVIFGPFFFWRLHCSWYIERGTDPQDLCVCVWFDYRSTQREPSHGTIIECRGNQSRWWRLLRLSRRCPPACQPHRMEERCTFKRLSLSLSLYLVSSFLSFFSFDSQGIKLVHNTSANVIITNQSLVLQNVGRSMAGNISCHASNVEGQAESQSIFLDVKCKFSRIRLKKKIHMRG